MKRNSVEQWHEDEADDICIYIAVEVLSPVIKRPRDESLSWSIAFTPC